MASTYSTSLRLELMATGDQSGTWGDTTNTNLGTLLEQAITGVLSVAQGDATLTLTSTDGASDQARNAVINLTGAMTGAQNVVVPNANKLYLIKNSTSGGFAVTVKTSAGTGVTVPAGTARWVYADGTNVVDGMSGPWSPSSNDAQALGISGTAWSDLFLASGGVINWVAGDVTITHSTNALAFAGATSGYSFDELVSTSGSGAGFVGFRATSTDSGAAAGPVLDLYRDSNSPAANDVLGQLLFSGEDSAGNTQEYASVQTIIESPTSTSESAVLALRTTRYGTAAQRSYFDSVWRPNTAGSSIAVMAGHMYGLTLSNNSGDATNDIDIAVGEATDSTVSDLIVLASALTKQLDATWAVGTNAGMLASGAAIANTTYHIFLIKRPDTGVVDIAADTSATGANIAANTNAAYTLRRRIGSIIRSGGAILAFSQNGDEFYLSASVLDVNASNPGTSAVTRTLTVPAGVAVEAFGAVQATNSNVNVSVGIFLSPLSISDQTPSTTAAPLAITGATYSAASGQERTNSVFYVRTNTSSQIRSRLISSDASVTLRIATYGWIDTRGRLAA